MKSLTRAAIVGLSLVAMSPLACLADLYSGTLTSGSGITGVNGWATGVTIRWQVTSTGSTWSYHYEFTTVEKALSHIILEVSSSFQLENLLTYSGTNITEDFFAEVQEYSSETQGGSNPNMPGPLWGVKFDGFAEDGNTWTIDFTSNRVPVWGDFYAVDGKGGSIAEAWNQGFLLTDGADGHIAVPDTVSQVPVPGAVLLGSIGLGAAGLRLRRRVTHP